MPTGEQFEAIAGSRFKLFAAIAASDITLISGDLQGIVTAIRLSHATMQNIHQNLFWALSDRVLGIPIGRIVVVAGEPVQLSFDWLNRNPCLDELLIPDFGITTRLPIR